MSNTREIIEHRVFRTRASRLGGHYHVRIFAAKAYNQTFAKLGELTMDASDYDNFCEQFAAEHLDE